MKNKKVLLIVTGSIAAILADKIIYAIQDKLKESNLNLDLNVVLTPAAEEINHFKMENPYLNDEAEWKAYTEEKRVLHIELIQNCELIVVAPCTVNTLAKIAHGISDNLATSCLVAAGNTIPMIIAMSGNTRMLENPITERNKEMVGEFLDVRFIGPVEKTLFCGETGKGALAHVDTIAKEVENVIMFG